MSAFLHHEVLRTARLANFTAILERKDRTRGSVYFRARESPKSTDPCRNVRKVAEYRKFPGESFGEASSVCQRTQSRFPRTRARSRGAGAASGCETSRVFGDFPGKDFERKRKGFCEMRSDPGVFLHSKPSRNSSEIILSSSPRLSAISVSRIFPRATNFLISKTGLISHCVRYYYRIFGLN